jgi:hypothetical protein
METLVAVIFAPLAGSADCGLLGTCSGRICSAREIPCSKLQLPRGCWLPGMAFPMSGGKAGLERRRRARASH